MRQYLLVAAQELSGKEGEEFNNKALERFNSFWELIGKNLGPQLEQAFVDVMTKYNKKALKPEYKKVLKSKIQMTNVQ